MHIENHVLGFEISTQKSTKLLNRIAIDVFGGIPKTYNGNAYIIVGGGYFSKWKETCAVSDHIEVGSKLATEFIAHWCSKSNSY